MLAIGLPLLACIAVTYMRIADANPPYTDLARYDITPSDQPVLMFEFSAARDQILIVTQATPPDDRRVVRVEAFLWDIRSRRATSIGQFDGVALREHSWERQDEATRSSDGDFFLFTRTLLRISSDGRMTSYSNRTQSLTPDEILRIARAYEDSGTPVYRIDRGVTEARQTAGRYYLFALDGQPFFLNSLTEDPLVVTSSQTPRERVMLSNPVVPLNAPINPAFTRESPLFDAWNNRSYESKGERMTVTARRNCFMVPLCPTYPKIIVKVARRGYAFESYRYPFVPQSGYMTTQDGTLFWLRDGHLYALR
ncbi:MAG: hypothetical protein U0232_18855 [Thermomicrobiales bacterium]